MRAFRIWPSVSWVLVGFSCLAEHFVGIGEGISYLAEHFVGIVGHFVGIVGHFVGIVGHFVFC